MRAGVVQQLEHLNLVLLHHIRESVEEIANADNEIAFVNLVSL